MIDAISFFIGGMVLGGLLTKIFTKPVEIKVTEKVEVPVLLGQKTRPENETEYDRVLRLIREKKIVVKPEDDHKTIALYTKSGERLAGWYDHGKTHPNWNEKSTWTYSPLLKMKPNGIHLRDLYQASLPSLDEIEGVELVEQDGIDDFLTKEFIEFEKRAKEVVS